MKITVTEEMRGLLEARRKYDAEIRASKPTSYGREDSANNFRRVSLRLASLVADAVEQAATEPPKACESGSHESSGTATTWTCRCGRTVCTDCEGGSESDLCDACWAEGVGDG